MSAAFVVVKDRFTDQHARQIIGEANSKAIESVARAICVDFGIDETVSVHVVWARDSGAARLMQLDDSNYLYDFKVTNG